MQLSLNRTQIKYIVVVAMLIDHIAWAFVPTASIAGQMMHFIGRLTGPTMAYFLYEGYIHTRSQRKYALRLAVFSLISWPSYCLLEYGKWPMPYFSVIFTLFVGFLAVLIWDKAPLPTSGKLLLIACLCLITETSDWAFFDVLCPLGLFVFRENRRRQWICFFGIAAVHVMSALLLSGAGWQRQIFQIGVLLAPLMLIYLYNGESGEENPFDKWFFYIFYPAHQLILYALKKL